MVQGDPAALEKAAGYLRKAGTDLADQARTINSAEQALHGAKGADVDRLRGDLKQMSQTLAKYSQAATEQGSKLTRAATEIRRITV